MGDGSVWEVSVETIARDRAQYYAHEFGGDVNRSLEEDTIPLFADDAYEIQDWAQNNMDWVDVYRDAIRVTGAPPVDFNEGWVNGEVTVIK